MNCSRCGRQLTEDKSYTYQGKIMCEDCLMDVGLSPHECDPWASYVDTGDRKRHGMTGADGLTETKVYDFIKAKGRATRQEVLAGLGLSEKELEAQLTALMHSELVKRRQRRQASVSYLYRLAITPLFNPKLDCVFFPE